MKIKDKPFNPDKKSWSFLVYIAGDNNLSENGLEDIRELCQEGASSDVAVGVEIDTRGDYTGSIRYEITKPDWTGTAHRTVIERLPEKDSGDPGTLTSFLDWGFSRYPAENCLVVIWNHGSGFRSLRRNIGYDDFGSSLDMPEIELAFERAGINSTNKIDILGFDACLMNMLEIAHHFKNHVNYIVGSQQTEPGDGWPYDKVLHKIKKTTSSQQLAKEIVIEYIKDYKRIGMSNVTQSAIHLPQTEQAVKALNNLGNELFSQMPALRDEMRRIRIMTQTFEMADYVDLIHLAQVIEQNISNQNVVNAAQQVITEAKKCIIHSETYGHSVAHANGLSIWFPAYESLYYGYRAKYLALHCNTENTGWISFLDTFHSN